MNVISNPSKAGGVPRLVADIQRARDLLDFAPQTSLSEGLLEMLARDRRFEVSGVT